MLLILPGHVPNLAKGLVRSFESDSYLSVIKAPTLGWHYKICMWCQAGKIASYFENWKK